MSVATAVARSGTRSSRTISRADARSRSANAQAGPPCPAAGAATFSGTPSLLGGRPLVTGTLRRRREALDQGRGASAGVVGRRPRGELAPPRGGAGRPAREGPPRPPAPPGRAGPPGGAEAAGGAARRRRPSPRARTS